MATVLALRSNRDHAVVVSDESTWHLGHVFGYRRTNYGDGLALIGGPAAAPEGARTAAAGAPDATPEEPVAAVYGGVGFPSFHDEVVRRLRAGEPCRANREMSERAMEAFVAVHRRLLDDKLRFDYGFTLDELNARRYQLDGKNREIQQDSVVAAARAAAAGGAKGNAFTRIWSNQGLIVSRDREHGVQCWYLSPTGSHMGFATPLAVVGDGDSVATHLLAEFLERRHVGRRRKGFGERDGLYVALRIAAEIRDRVGTMGGYLQIAVLGPEGAREVVSDSAHTATEVMRAHRWGFVGRRDAEEMVADLILDGAADTEVEARMFGCAGSQAGTLERYLMGFKAEATPHATSHDPPPTEDTPSGTSLPAAARRRTRPARTAARGGRR